MPTPPLRRTLLALAAILLPAALTGGCATYRVPGASADFRALGITPAQQHNRSDVSVINAMDRQPAASFPARIAVARVQGPRYRSYTIQSAWGNDHYTVISERDVETQEDFERVSSLPMVDQVTPLNRFVLPRNPRDLSDLRTAAGSIQADMLLVYTFDTRFGVTNHAPFLGAITLGLFPKNEARVTSTCSAALIDTRSGYVYGLVEATARTEQMANTWTTAAATDQSRRRAERDAFEDAVGQFETMWLQVASSMKPEAAVGTAGVMRAPKAKAQRDPQPETEPQPEPQSGVQAKP